MKRSLVPLVLLPFLAAACGGEEADVEPLEETPATTPAAEATAPSPPDTTAEAVWAHLQSESYQDWPLWPDKGRLYSGTEPHGMLLTTYVNPAAMSALEESAATIPGGGIVVKENYMPDSTLASVTVMYKTESFNAEHANWWFMKRLADGTVEAAGRVEGCQSCHGERSDNDYIMTADLPLGSGSSGSAMAGDTAGR